MPFSPRLLQLRGEVEACREIEALGIPSGEARHLAATAAQGALRLSGVPRDLARILARSCAASDVAILPAECREDDNDLLLFGTFANLRRVARDIGVHASGVVLSSEMTAALGSADRPLVLLGKRCRLSLERPLIMGVLNVTPDSFFPESRSPAFDAALKRGVALAGEGADLIDIGGESTRPGAQPVSEEEEAARVVPLVEALRREVDIPISVDTTKSRVALNAIEAGAEFINDISGLRFDSAMSDTVAETGAGLFLMHTRGRPNRMQDDTEYRDLIGEILAYLSEGVSIALRAGVDRQKISIDPGIGFGKSAEGNLQILRRLGEFCALGFPVLLGTSRKGFIGRVLDQPDPGRRLFGTLATVALGVACGAHIFRVHDVGPAREAALMAWSIRQGELPSRF